MVRPRDTKTHFLVLSLLVILLVVAGCTTPATQTQPAPVATSPAMQAPAPASTTTLTPSSTPTPPLTPAPTPTPIPIPTTPTTVTSPSTPSPSTVSTPTLPTIPPTTPKPTLEDMVLKSDDLPSGYQPVSETREVGKRIWQMLMPNSPVNSLNIILKSGGSTTGVVRNYILLCSKSEAMDYYKQLKELKDSNLTITELTIGDGGFTRVVRGPRLELNQITNVEQFKDIVVKDITVCFTKGAYYVTISSGPLELTSEKDVISLLQNLARNVEKRIPAQ